MAGEREPGEEPAEIHLPDPLQRLLGPPPLQPLALVGPTFLDQREAEEWARQNIRGLKHVEYTGVDLDVVNALNQTVKAISDRYQADMLAIAPHSWEGWMKSGTAFMSADWEGIRYNPELITGLPLQEFLIVWAYAPFSSAANRDLPAIVAHEMGHVLHDSGRGSENSRLSPDTSRAIAREIVERFRSRRGEVEIRSELGNRAWLGNEAHIGLPLSTAWQETWANAFSAFISDPRTLSPETVKMVNEVLSALHLD